MIESPTTIAPLSSFAPAPMRTWLPTFAAGPTHACAPMLTAEPMTAPAPTTASRSTQLPAPMLRALFKLFQHSAPKTKAETMVQRRPQHETNYLADIGMEIGF